jgi:hypothetical protein
MRLLLFVGGATLAACVALANERSSSSLHDAQRQQTTAGSSQLMPIVNVIDVCILKKLHAEGISPSVPSSDEEFLRRLTINVTGQLPTSDEVRTFLADQRSDKRALKIDELLDHPLHAAVWATKFCELTGNSRDALEEPDVIKPKRAKMWHDWFRRRFEHNVPYDDIVRGVLTATSREGSGIDDWIDRETELIHAARDGFDARYADRANMDLFWRRGGGQGNYPIEEVAERIASSYMGVRINCARCHQHPFDSWTQNDFNAFANVFGQVRFDMSPELRVALTDRLDRRRIQRAAGEAVGPPPPRLGEVYLTARPVELRDPVALTPVIAKALGGPTLGGGDELTASSESPADYRVNFMEWLNEPGNPYFARNIVNRVWAHHFGRGFVEPLDGFSAANPPSHPELLALLAEDLVDHDYDLRRLERIILNSSTWQLSSAPNESNRTDEHHFARTYVRMPSPEAFVDMWLNAVGIAGEFGPDVPAGVRAVEIAPSQLSGTEWDRLLSLYGRRSRASTCDCEAPSAPSIRQTLSLMSDPFLLHKLGEGRVKQMLTDKLPEEVVIDELFLNTLSRRPTEDEKTAALKHLSEAAELDTAYVDLLWSLVNSQEFITNH